MVVVWVRCGNFLKVIPIQVIQLCSTQPWVVAIKDIYDESVLYVNDSLIIMITANFHTFCGK